MDARTDKPWTRGGFKHDLETWVPAHRGEIIAALLTLVRAWYAAGKPADPAPKKMGSFQSWIETIGGILAHSYVEGFLANAHSLQEEDDDTHQWAAFLHAMRAHYRDDHFLSSLLARDIKAGATEISDTLEGVAGLYAALPDDLDDIHKGDFKRRPSRTAWGRASMRVACTWSKGNLINAVGPSTGILRDQRGNE